MTDPLEEMASMPATVSAVLTAGIALWLRQQAARREMSVSELLREIIEEAQARSAVAA